VVHLRKTPKRDPDAVASALNVSSFTVTVSLEGWCAVRIVAAQIARITLPTLKKEIRLLVASLKRILMLSVEFLSAS